MYFSNFENMVYEFNIAGKDTAIFLKDITRNVRFGRDVLANITVYDEYDIIGNETPEHIAEKFYGNPQYHWVIMLANECYDYASDFPLAQDILEQYISDKYDNPYGIHHYADNAGFVVNSDASGAVSVSNSDYEYSINESKRRIKIIPQIYVNQIISEFKKII
jgi:hypothetical protein